jgi:hypothetical protein
MKIIFNFSLVIICYFIYKSNAMSIKSWENFLQNQYHLSDWEMLVLTYLQEIDVYLKENIIDESQKNRAIEKAHILIREVERVHKERVNTFWKIRHG